MNGTDSLFDMEESVYEVSIYTSHAVVDPGISDVGTGQMAWGGWVGKCLFSELIFKME